MTLDDELRQQIHERLEQLKQGVAKRSLLHNMLYPEQQKKRDKASIDEKLHRVREVHDQAVGYVKKLKATFSAITDQTENCAVYLIYGKVIRDLEGLYLLVENGLTLETLILCRSIEESLDLIKLFHTDEAGKHLAEWYKGEIIDHQKARRAMDEFLSKGNFDFIASGEVSPYDLVTDIHRVLSKFTHPTYGAILDSVDVFNHDFDWNKYAGFHYALRNFHAVEQAVVSLLTTLKLTFLKLGQIDNFTALSKILTDFAGPMDEESLKELLPKVSKRNSKK